MAKIKRRAKEAFIAFRAPQELIDRVDKICASKEHPYELSRSYLARRGLELALKELEKRK